MKEALALTMCKEAVVVRGQFVKGVVDLANHSRRISGGFFKSIRQDVVNLSGHLGQFHFRREFALHECAQAINGLKIIGN